MNKDPKEIDSEIFLDAVVNIIGKKIKKGISSIASLGITNNERYYERYCDDINLL